ncbi:hypothetical protein RHRU231_590102 [Rhodococcus ruber]|uniref:Uncharacterized protein n=1 Tax=Rhodococcus ruber TaxID=1830 RepID=A0A098BMW2_9NOCA|nr:hypothetical protein RHRU231_590102 [Rhodococcus ruber]
MPASRSSSGRPARRRFAALSYPESRKAARTAGRVWAVHSGFRPTLTAPAGAVGRGREPRPPAAPAVRAGRCGARSGRARTGRGTGARSASVRDRVGEPHPLRDEPRGCLAGVVAWGHRPPAGDDEDTSAFGLGLRLTDGDENSHLRSYLHEPPGGQTFGRRDGVGDLR